MAYDKGLAERLRNIFADQPDVIEREMFGGLAFMVAGNMCCGVSDDRLMARVGPENYQQALSRSHTAVMDFTGKPLKGFIYIWPEGYESEEQLSEWVTQCLEFVNTLPPKQIKEAS